ncbi:MAG: tetratricopeptide repeat protein [Planctomycetota bacterium]|nr:tetratricopeptide repeat protein [Planctomycetota bacterium]
MSRAAAAIQNAIALFEGGKAEQAKATLRQTLQRAPQDAQANKVLAMIHGALHEDEQAYVFIARAALAAPNDAEIQFMLGNVCTILRRYKDGVRAYTAAAKLNPANLEAHDGLGKCLLGLGEYDRSMEAYEAGLRVAPDNPDLYFRMGVSLALIGRIDAALRVAERGLARIPGDASLLEFLAYYRNFADGVDPIAHRDEHAALGRTLPAAPAAPFANVRDPERPLRVAFLSADFYFHACAFFLLGPLREFDRARLVPYLYALPTRDDEFTARFRTLGEWRDCNGRTPDEIAAMMHADAIDVVVECCGWTERRVMHAAARRLAPVQCTYLGYPNTTGLASVGHRLVDAVTDPAPIADAHCTERLARLPGCFLCYQPPPEAPAQFDPTPPSASPGAAGVTFGSFNRVMKVGPTAVATWARILREVPGSTLLIKIQVAADEVAPAFAARFAEHGVDPARIRSAPWSKKPGEHFPNYRLMDIALDSFPYNGTTTTCECTWMGVPVVALAGDTHRARVGASLLATLGSPELIAPTPDEYVRIAVDLARDPARLAAYHATSRQRMAASPLVDASGFARRFEGTLRELWREWCRSGA